MVGDDEMKYEIYSGKELLKTTETDMCGCINIGLAVVSPCEAELWLKRFGLKDARVVKVEA